MAIGHESKQGSRVAKRLGARYPFRVMRSISLIIVLVAGLFSAVAASAGDRASPNTPPPVIGPHPPIWRFNGPPQDAPFSRSAGSQAVWDGGTCWSQCGAYCAWSMTQCLYDDATQGSCVVNNDSCDLICQRACRTDGGPFLPID